MEKSIYLNEGKSFRPKVRGFLADLSFSSSHFLIDVLNVPLEDSFENKWILVYTDFLEDNYLLANSSYTCKSIEYKDMKLFDISESDVRYFDNNPEKFLFKYATTYFYDGKEFIAKHRINLTLPDNGFILSDRELEILSEKNYLTFDDYIKKGNIKHLTIDTNYSEDWKEFEITTLCKMYFNNVVNKDLDFSDIKVYLYDDDGKILKKEYCKCCYDNYKRIMSERNK